MVDLRNRLVPQDGDCGDDGDAYKASLPQAPPDENGSSVILVIIYVLRMLIFLVQTGFTALASAAVLSRDVIFDASATTSPHAPPYAPQAPYAFQAPYVPQAPQAPQVPAVPPPPYYLAPPGQLGERWYAVYVGRTIGVFSEWSDVADATVGVRGNSQRRFGTRAEAITSFHAAVQRGIVRIIPDDVPAEASGSNTAADCGDPKDTKPFAKKEEPDD
ncbi:hypothetical protein BD410DRAFT_845700 [Rickenella mellea]|uniref:Ribonuclease H1 N-terminal domain-containing protein n=1 Tax=Rickenella mellea TaxID=50990 RepID=A0A4Y7PIZ8_9AGAM|nr:hypothetical protein BD410DRAFT_845700 [Rickenella mellea]